MIHKPVFNVMIPFYNPTYEELNHTLKSVFNQKGNVEYRVWILDDCSTDEGTKKAIRKYLDKPNVIYRKRITHLGNPLLNLKYAINEIVNPWDFIVQVDGDGDRIAIDTLMIFNMYADDDNVWIMGGNYNNKSKERMRPYKQFTRRDGWCYCHPRCFRKWLFDKIPERELINPETGEYWILANDVAYFWPMIEMAGPKHTITFDNVLYYHNYPKKTSMAATVNNHKKRNTHISMYLISKQPFWRISGPDAIPRHKPKTNKQLLKKKGNMSITLTINP